MNKQDKPIKVSVDFRPDLFQIIKDIKDRNGKSTSYVINETVGAVLSLTPSIKDKLREFCLDNINSQKQKLKSYIGYEEEELKNEISQWEVLYKFFGDDTSQIGIPSSMRRIYIKDGYVIFPSEWTVLDNIDGKATECSYAGVVECRNGANYGEDGKPVPHFVFFVKDAKYARDYSDELKDKVFEACAKEYPRFAELYNLQPSPADWAKIDKQEPTKESIEEADKLMKLPYFGIFNIPVKGDPAYWNAVNKNYVPPYGAVVIKNGHNEKE